MELRIFMSLLCSALAFLAIGSIAYFRPAHFGGDFKLVRTSKLLSIKHNISTNDFIIKNTKIIGAVVIMAGLLLAVFAVVYLFCPEILLVLNSLK